MPTIKATLLKDSLPGKFRTEVTSNRPIAGTATPSEHSYGNAIDIFGTSNEMATLAAKLNRERAKWSIATLCYDGKGSPGYDRCTTKHTDHIHVDFSPKCGTAGIPTTGSDFDRMSRCQAYQEGKSPTGPIVTGEETILGGILDPVTGPLMEGLQRAAVVIGGVAIGAIAIALILGDLKLKGAGKVLKGWLK